MCSYSSSAKFLILIVAIHPPEFLHFGGSSPKGQTSSALLYSPHAARRHLPPTPHRIRGRGAAAREGVVPLLGAAGRSVPRVSRLPGRHPGARGVRGGAS